MRLTMDAADEGRRIDALLAEKTGITRSRIQRLIEEGLVLVGGRAIKPNYRARAGDGVSITEPEKPLSDKLTPEDIPLEILYRDGSILVIDKPPGMVVYPAAGHRSGTLMNAVAYHIGRYNAPGGPLRPGVVHRLDRDTSGVMVVALDDKAYYSLIEQFKEREISKRYIALVWGRVKGEKGEISSTIGRSEADRKKMSTRARRGKEARTIWSVAERLRNATLVKIRLETGRTHQIRVHFASEGHPVLGDRLYGKKTAIGDVHFPRQMLHAACLGFTHPVTGGHMEFESPMPEDMERAVGELRTA